MEKGGRKHTEAELKKMPISIEDLSISETRELLHELKVHQFELEMQNEELRTLQYRLEETRDQYTSLFDFAPVGYFILDQNGVILNVNLKGCSMLGRDRTRIKGKPFSVYLETNETNYSNFYKCLNNIITSTSTTTYTCELSLKKNGEFTFPALLEGIAEVDENGKITTIRVIIRDLTTEKKTTELQRLNEELINEKNTAQMYLDVANTMFVLIDKNKNVTLINQKGCEVLECSESEIINKNWFENFVPKNQKKKIEEIFNKAINGEIEKIEQYNTLVLTKKRKERLISWNYTVLRDEHEQVIGILNSGEDITNRNLVENSLRKSERMYRTLFESATESIITMNSKGSIITANQTAISLFEYNGKELYGNSIKLLIPLNDEKYSTSTSRYLEGLEFLGNRRKKTLYAVKKSGEEFPIKISLSNIVDDKETITMVWINDVTISKQRKEKLIELNTRLEHKVLERTYELLESQRMYKTIARNFPNGVISVFDVNLNYVFVEGMEMFKRGIKDNMLIGKNFIDLISPKIRDDIQKKMMNVFKGRNAKFELKIENKIYMINAVGLDGPNNKITQILMVTQDITNLKKAERDIKESLKKEQRLNELKSRFVSMASHEFRTPLTTIMNSTTLLSKYIESEDEKPHNHVKRIKTSIHHLTNILNDFLSLDKLEHGKIELNNTEFNFLEYSQDLIMGIEVTLTKGQRIIYKHEGETMINIDKHLLNSILYNLLSNAIKYSKDGGLIRFDTVIINEVLMIIVQDEGMGIPEEEQKHLFERFFRAKNVDNIQGTGLGLNIVKKYLDIVNGEINFISEYDKGTSFVIEIPIPKQQQLELE